MPVASEATTATVVNIIDTDIEGYRGRREKTLEELAEKITEYCSEIVKFLINKKINFVDGIQRTFFQLWMVLNSCLCLFQRPQLPLTRKSGRSKGIQL